MMAVMVFCVAVCPSVSATQWSQDPGHNLLVSGEDAIYQDYPLTAPCPDGSTYVSWLSWEDETACLKLQLIDSSGDLKLGAEGKYISRNPTPTWSSGFDIATDGAGNAVIVYSDKRNGVWQAYAYKVSPDGEMLWGDGVALSADPVESCLNPKVLISDTGNIYFAYQALTDTRNSIKISKLDTEGKKSWGGQIEVTGSNGLFQMALSGQDSMYLAWFQADKGNLAVMRYTANGDEAWDAPVVIDEGSAVVSSEPTVCADGNGGIVVCWRHSLGMTQVDGCIQAVARDGKCLWANSESFPNVPHACVDGDKNIVAVCTQGVDYEDNIMMSKYGPDGSLLWETGELLDNPANRLTIYGVRDIEGDAVAVYRNTSGLGQATICYAQATKGGETVTADGKVSTMKGDKGFGRLAYDRAGQMVLAWSDNGGSDNGGRIYAQNIVPEVTSVKEIFGSCGTAFSPVYSGGVIRFAADGTDALTEVYDMAGSKLASCRATVEGGYATARVGILPQGLYIVKNGGESAKILVK